MLSNELNASTEAQSYEARTYNIKGKNNKNTDLHCFVFCTQDTERHSEKDPYYYTALCSITISLALTHQTACLEFG